MLEDRYLGDGVYASTDGHSIFLDLRAQDNTTRIALEPAVMMALRRFQTDLNRAVDERHIAQQAALERAEKKSTR